MPVISEATRGWSRIDEFDTTTLPHAFSESPRKFTTSQTWPNLSSFALTGSPAPVALPTDKNVLLSPHTKNSLLIKTPDRADRVDVDNAGRIAAKPTCRRFLENIAIHVPKIKTTSRLCLTAVRDDYMLEYIIDGKPTFPTAFAMEAMMQVACHTVGHDPSSLLSVEFRNLHTSQQPIYLLPRPVTKLPSTRGAIGGGKEASPSVMANSTDPVAVATLTLPVNTETPSAAVIAPNTLAPQCHIEITAKVVAPAKPRGPDKRRHTAFANHSNHHHHKLREGEEEKAGGSNIHTPCSGSSVGKEEVDLSPPSCSVNGVCPGALQVWVTVSSELSDFHCVNFSSLLVLCPASPSPSNPAVSGDACSNPVTPTKREGDGNFTSINKQEIAAATSVDMPLVRSLLASSVNLMPAVDWQEQGPFALGRSFYCYMGGPVHSLLVDGASLSASLASTTSLSASSSAAAAAAFSSAAVAPASFLPSSHETAEDLPTNRRLPFTLEAALPREKDKEKEKANKSCLRTEEERLPGTDHVCLIYSSSPSQRPVPLSFSPFSSSSSSSPPSPLKSSTTRPIFVSRETKREQEKEGKAGTEKVGEHGLLGNAYERQCMLHGFYPLLFDSKLNNNVHSNNNSSNQTKSCLKVAGSLHSTFVKSWLIQLSPSPASLYPVSASSSTTTSTTTFSSSATPSTTPKAGGGAESISAARLVVVDIACNQAQQAIVQTEIGRLLEEELQELLSASAGTGTDRAREGEVEGEFGMANARGGEIRKRGEKRGEEQNGMRRSKSLTSAGRPYSPSYRFALNNNHDNDDDDDKKEEACCSSRSSCSSGKSGEEEGEVIRLLSSPSSNAVSMKSNSTVSGSASVSSTPSRNNEDLFMRAARRADSAANRAISDKMLQMHRLLLTGSPEHKQQQSAASGGSSKNQHVKATQRETKEEKTETEEEKRSTAVECEAVWRQQREGGGRMGRRLSITTDLPCFPLSMASSASMHCFQVSSSSAAAVADSFAPRMPASSSSTPVTCCFPCSRSTSFEIASVRLKVVCSQSGRVVEQVRGLCVTAQASISTTIASSAASSAVSAASSRGLTVTSSACPSPAVIADVRTACLQAFGHKIALSWLNPDLEDNLLLQRAAASLAQAFHVHFPSLRVENHHPRAIKQRQNRRNLENTMASRLMQRWLETHPPTVVWKDTGAPSIQCSLPQFVSFTNLTRLLICSVGNSSQGIDAESVLSIKAVAGSNKAARSLVEWQTLLHDDVFAFDQLIEQGCDMQEAGTRVWVAKEACFKANNQIAEKRVQFRRQLQFTLDRYATSDSVEEFLLSALNHTLHDSVPSVPLPSSSTLPSSFPCSLASSSPLGNLSSLYCHSNLATMTAPAVGGGLSSPPSPPATTATTADAIARALAQKERESEHQVSSSSTLPVSRGSFDFMLHEATSSVKGSDDGHSLLRTQSLRSSSSCSLQRENRSNLSVVASNEISRADSLPASTFVHSSSSPSLSTERINRIKHNLLVCFRKKMSIQLISPVKQRNHITQMYDSVAASGILFALEGLLVLTFEIQLTLGHPQMLAVVVSSQ